MEKEQPNKKVFYIRDNRKLRLFRIKGTDIEDITYTISEKGKYRITKKGYLSVPGYGMDPIDSIRMYFPDIEFIRIYDN